MVSELLHAFFFGMPTVLVVIASFSLKSPAARKFLFWGGLLFTVPVWAGLAGMLACDGRVLTGFSNCAGGSAVSGFFAWAAPLLSLSVYAYILIGAPLAIAACCLEWAAGRRTQA